MAITHLLHTENEQHYYVHTVETIYYDNKWESVVKVGGFRLDMVHLMNFGGTPKMKKFLNISIKVCEDEIFSTSVWYH